MNDGFKTASLTISMKLRKDTLSCVLYTASSGGAMLADALEGK
jgi:hypothetical protein